jgi:lysophospholipase L1-like esterase
LNQRIASYNAAMPALVAERVAAGKHLLLVDMYTAFTDNAQYKTALLADNLHPTEAGYAVLGAVWHQAITGFLR